MTSHEERGAILKLMEGSSDKAGEVRTRCVVAGGGPAGIMLGYLLARAGIDVVVLEKWPDFFRDFRGDTIHPSTMEVLDELGLLEDFLKLPHNEMARMALTIGGKRTVVADLSRLRTKCPYIAFIPQWDFLTFLAKHAVAYPSFHLRMETEATDLLCDESGRVIGVKAEHKGEAFDIHAELVIGADGRHSVIREKGGFLVTELGVPIDVLWFRIARTDVDDKESLGSLAAGGALVMLDRREYWQCAYVIRKGAFEGIKANGLPEFRRTIAELAHLPESAIAEVDSWDKVKLLSVSVDHVRTWAKEGVALIGDAAHAMSPIGGVGINYAVQDAVAAANILAPAFRKGSPALATLARIQARRQPPVLRMQKLQVFIQNRIFSPLLGAARVPAGVRRALRLFSWFPVLRRIPAHIIGIGFLPEHVSEAIRQGVYAHIRAMNTMKLVKNVNKPYTVDIDNV